MDKYQAKILKCYQQADACLTRKQAKKLIKKADKAHRKHEQRREDSGRSD